MSNSSFSLVIPLWNEGANIEQLIDVIEQSGLPEQGMSELVAINNGSTDETGPILDQLAKQHDWLVPIHLENNLNYGGGVYEGMKYATEEIVCYIPGDLQVMPDDILKVHQVFKSSETNSGGQLFVKGHRAIRHDPMQTRVVSRVYTLLGNIVLGLHTRDVNGLPKMFHKSLLNEVPQERMVTFVFDSQLISLARRDNWQIIEVPVTFHSRREGVSSWSGKRIRVYIEVFRQLFALRRLRRAPGIPLEQLDRPR